MRIEVLTEGASDEPVVRVVLERHFKLSEQRHFTIHPHRGKGMFPGTKPEHLKHEGLLNQLERKLAAYGKTLGESDLVVVLLDVDDDNCIELLQELNTRLNALSSKPKRVLFRLAIEEIESWFIADLEALKSAYPTRRITRLKAKKIAPDAIIGAAERLAEHLGIKPESITGTLKKKWAEQIAPYLNLDEPCSPSLRKFLEGLTAQIDAIRSELKTRK